ncbi:hypothetical protein TNCV_1605371 [Trichonephila clavipes]|nr:hypothetical protein TNCV_1605371 [Trichonephila clavipes]
MHRHQSVRPHIWTLCPPRRHSTVVLSVRQASPIVTRRGHFYVYYDLDILSLRTRDQTTDDDPKGMCAVSDPQATLNLSRAETSSRWCGS